MTGPDHYRAAETLIEESRNMYGNQSREQKRTATLARAQVHATLALAAATALNDADIGMEVKDLDAWRKVAAVPMRTGTEQ